MDTEKLLFLERLAVSASNVLKTTADKKLSKKVGAVADLAWDMIRVELEKESA